MNEQTNQLIEKMAEKLGTTAEYLWAVIIKQAPITAVTNIAGIIIMVLVLLISATLIRKFIKDDACDDADFYRPMAWLFWAVLTIVFTFVTLDSISTTVTCLANPEYWALKQIIK